MPSRLRFEDHSLPGTPRVARLLHGLIVRLGLRNSVIAITIPLVLLATTLSVPLGLLVGLQITAAGHLVAAGVTLLLGVPLITLAADLILRLDRSQRIQQYLATHDSLTELCSRREFFRRAAQTHERARRAAASSWLVMIDLDGFKAINDEWGHLAGDRALRHAADLCRAEARPVDVLGRYGGDEIAMLLVGVDRESAMTIATRLRKRIAETRLAIEGRARLKLSASIGLAEIAVPHGTIERGLADADAALRRAKRLGHNRMCTYGEDWEAEAVAA